MCKQSVVFGEYALNAENDKVMAPRRQEVQNAAVVLLARSCFYCCWCRSYGCSEVVKI